MKLPNFRRLLKTDYAAEYSSLIETLSFSLNTGIEVLYQALNKSLTLKDNIACTVKDIDVEVNSSGVPKTTLSFSISNSSKVLGLTVLNVINSKNPTILPTSGVFISFYQEGRNVFVSKIIGLPENQVFTLTVVAFDS